ncbi:hypothetical protein Pla123a_13370 [Posidoniimonas polymericola]|uniref:Uncharacterized protein n=1 Tax=Posidoniimonas polymericola TaxID=2528002 RepID=A0A5C5YU84_9BACT|nr:hypothetical protein [Posidoniimonas polymericola]TWT78544.1 hypothetical protein Pla123a_13370 [Posidoniimonas polymericola]
MNPTTTRAIRIANKIHTTIEVLYLMCGVAAMMSLYSGEKIYFALRPATSQRM